MRELDEKIHAQMSKSISDKFCRECSGTCCNPQRYKILIDETSLNLFQKKGSSIIGIEQLNRSSLRHYKKRISSKLLLKNGSEVPKPSLVQLKLFQQGMYLYADICPFYGQNKGCEIHEDPRRPQVCKQYPLSFSGCEDPKGRFLDFRIMKSCEYVEDVRSFLQENFPIRIVN